MKYAYLISTMALWATSGFLSPLAGATVANVNMIADPVNPEMQICQQPGSLTLLTHIDGNGKISYEFLSAPETPEQIRTKQLFVENAASKHTLTVTSTADKQGQNEVPYTIFVMKDTYMFWNAERTATGTFELPEGKYDVQVIYNDSWHSIVNFPNVDLTSSKSISVNADMADKIIYLEMLMPDGKPMTLPLREDPDFVYNTSQVACHEVVLINGATQFFQSITTANGGNHAYTNFAIKSNFGDNTEVCWNALTWKTDAGHIGMSLRRDGNVFSNGQKIHNDVADYYKMNPEFRHTPLYDKSGAENTILQMGINLFRPDDTVLSGFALNISEPSTYYTCAPKLNNNTFYTLINFQEMEVYPKYGRKLGIYSPSLANTESGMQYLCNQFENPMFDHGAIADSPQTARKGAPFNPWFSYPYSPSYVFATSTPYAAVGSKIAKSGDISYNTYSVATYYGNFAENRFVDSQYYTEEAKMNGQDVDLSKFRNANAWLESLATEGKLKDAPISIKFINTNAKTGNLDSRNECEISFVGEAADAYPPTAQRIMFRDETGAPNISLTSNQKGILSIAGGDFKPVDFTADFGAYTETVTTYEYSPATLKVEIAPYSSTDFEELPMTEYKDRYVFSYGSYWEGSLGSVQAKSENKWYDLRVTMTDAAGNKQVQLISPAVYIETIASGLDTPTAMTPGLSIVDGSIVTTDGSEIAVYNLTGMRVANNRLPKGIYVVVGKDFTSKVVIR